jgi:hypothetical protein
MDIREEDLIGRLVPLWHVTRRWAEDLLLVSLGFKRAGARPSPGHGVIPGTNWFYRFHGYGVDIDCGMDCGGIDFDFNQPEPDAFRLHNFAQRQLNVGALDAAAYGALVRDEERFVHIAEVVLKRLEGG